MDVRAEQPEKQEFPKLVDPVNRFKKEPLLSVIPCKIFPRSVNAAASDLYMYWELEHNPAAYSFDIAFGLTVADTAILALRIVTVLDTVNGVFPVGVTVATILKVTSLENVFTLTVQLELLVFSNSTDEAPFPVIDQATE